MALALLAPTLAHAETIAFDETNFPDANFRTYLSVKHATAISGGNINTDKVTSIDFTYSTGGSIVDLTGLKLFTKLTSITLPAKPKFEVLDVSEMPVLATVTNGQAHDSGSYTSPSAAQVAAKTGILKIINASNCPKLTTLNVHFCQTVEEINIEGSTALTTVNFSYTAVKKMDISHCVIGRPSSGASQSSAVYFWNDNCSNLKELKLGEQPYITNLNLSKCAVRSLDLSGLTGAKYTGSTAINVNLGYNKLKKLILGSDTYKNLSNLLLYNNQLTCLNPPYADYNIYISSFPATTQNVYCGKGVMKYKLFSTAEHHYPNKYAANSGGSIVQEGNDYYFVFNNATTAGKYTYTIGYNSTTTTMTVNLLRQDDPDFEAAELSVIDHENGERQHILNHLGNGVYSADVEYLSGNYRIAEHDTNGKLVASLGGHNDEDINTADEFVWTQINGPKYTLVPSAEKSLTTHPDQNWVNNALENKTYGYRYPNILVTYRPLDDEYNLTLTANPHMYIAGRTTPYATPEDYESRFNESGNNGYLIQFAELEGHFRVKFIDPVGNILHDFGAVAPASTQDLNPTDTSVLPVVLGQVYTLVDDSPVSFTTHPDIANHQLVKFNNANVTVNYNPSGTSNMIVTATTFTGVDDISVEEYDANAPVEYFDLQGRRVANPGHGIYIKRQGSRATKVAL